MDSLEKASSEGLKNANPYWSSPAYVVPDAYKMPPNVAMTDGVIPEAGMIQHRLEAGAPSRERLKSIFDLAGEVVRLCEHHGLRKGEQNAFKEFFDRLWWAD